MTKTIYIIKLIYFILVVIPLAMIQGQSNEDCLTCHSDESLTMERKGKQISIYINNGIYEPSAHGKLNCISCHKGYKIDELPHTKRIYRVDCSPCHKKIEEKHVFHPSLAESIIKGKKSDEECNFCHNPHKIPSSKSIGGFAYEIKIVESCNNCHSDISDEYKISAHGQAVTNNMTDAPNCLTCHRHKISDITGVPDSLNLKIQQEKLCLSCHLDNPEVRKKTSHSAGFIASYENSVHAKALQEGNFNAAGCTNCHGSHGVAKSVDPISLTNSRNIPGMCGKCHEDVYLEYSESIHGTALQRGIKDAPSCTDCHGEHNILSTTDPKSQVEALNVSSKVCSPCHSSLRLTEKYGLSPDRFKTFSDSYHGLANKAGAIEVANCASCHGVHNIKPSSDSSSTINKSNLVQTCGKCHPGANQRFVTGSVHVTRNPEEEPLLYWISTAYIILIIITIGGMGIHNIIDFIRKSKQKLLIRRGVLPDYSHSHRLYIRMTLNERIQHGILLISFTTLVLTGFALRFPDAWWVVSLRNLSPAMFDIRSIVHRIAGVVLLGVSLYHLYYITFIPRGKQLIRDLLPEMKDLTDILSSIKYNLGLSNEKPLFKRFSYIEKVEYWALIWGTVIMGITGIILWFDNTFLGLLTKIGWDAAREVHYYEAWLATLAIIVWHLYFVIFNPDVYPLNVAFWKGTLTEAEMHHEHPLELEEIKKKEQLEKLKKLSEEKKNQGEILPGDNDQTKTDDGDNEEKPDEK